LLVRSSVLGLLAASVPNVLYAQRIDEAEQPYAPADNLPHDRHPAIQLEVASEIVGVSHFNLERLKAIVEPRPELAKAVWDWGFGDWESAIGAASHVGRKDIITYLISKGAMPSIFTYAVLGEFEIVRTMIEAYPGIQRNFGPHGISLLQHAKTGLQTDGVNKTNAQKLVDHLQNLGDADGKTYLETSEDQKTKFVGDYKYGTGNSDGFTIKLNMRKLLALGKLGKSGGSLLRIGDNEFTYQGAPSVTIKFVLENNVVRSLILNEPGLTLTAVKQ
jgi:hypothetical protein